MKYLVASVAVMLGAQAMTVQQAFSATVAGIVSEGKWDVAQGPRDGKPAVVRYRGGFESHPDVTNYPHRLTVTWNIKPDASGKVAAASYSALDKFEDQLINALEKDLSAVLIAVVTEPGTRQWVLYTNNESICTKRIGEFSQRNGPYPITLQYENDPAWAFFYEGVLGGVRN